MSCAVACRLSRSVRYLTVPSRPARSASYRSLEAAELVRLPLSQLTADGALVAVWCTNSVAHRRTLCHTLLPAWGVTEVATWHWVKVSGTGHVRLHAASGTRVQASEMALFRSGGKGWTLVNCCLIFS